MEENRFTMDIERLPSEIKLNIIKFLDDRSARFLRLANENWFQLIHYDTFNFYYTTNNQLDQITQRLKKYTIPTRISFTNHKLSLQRKHFEDLSKLTHVVSINVKQTIQTSIESDFEPLTSLPNLEIVPFGMPGKLFTSFVHLTQLKLYIGELASNISLQSYSKLVSLSWILGEGLQPHQLPDPLQNLHCPQLLTALTIQNGRSSWLDSNFDRFSSLKQLKFLDFQPEHCELKEFPALPNLEDLMLHTRSFLPLVALTNLTNLELRFHSANQERISTLAALTKLKILRITMLNSSKIDDFHFMTALSGLKCFGVCIYQERDPKSCPIYPFISPTLTRLEVYPDLDMKHVTHLTNLIDLKVIHDIHNTQQLLNMTHLTALEFPVKTMDEVKVIEQLTGLKALTLHTLRWPKVKFQIEKLVRLEELRCTGKFEDLFIDGKSLQDLPLKKINIMMKSKRSLLKSIANITTLEEISLQDFSLGNKKLPNLENLSHLTSLQLSFRHNGSCARVTRLTSLQRLVVTYYGTIDTEATKLRSKLPRLWHCELILYRSGFID